MKSPNFKIFVINLDRSASRWEKMRAQLEDLGLPYERFSAIDAQKVPDEFLNKYYSAKLNREKYYVSLSKSEIACYISHLKLCEKIVAENLDYAIILEDDIVLNGLFKLVPFALNSIKNWNYIKLIAPFKSKKIVSRESVDFEFPAACGTDNAALKYDSNACEAAAATKGKANSPKFELVCWRKPPAGTQAYAITKDGASEFISKRSRFYRPVDMDLQFTWETNLEIMGLMPQSCEIVDIASQITRRKDYHYPFARLFYKLKYIVCSLKNRRNAGAKIHSFKA
ncbi:MAG: glycosyltransferase family 25 protein [Opitutales bacterium]|nr:glycosyltransferase family 25 protein [Opitutales bacterium]